MKINMLDKFFNDKTPKLFQREATALHAVCIEAPDSNLKTVHKRFEVLMGKREGIAALTVILDQLEEHNFLTVEVRKNNGKENLFYHPTDSGKKLDQTYFSRNEAPFDNTGTASVPVLS